MGGLPGCPRCDAPVYWDDDGQNFYCTTEKKGCGWVFYETHRNRIADFPKGQRRVVAAPKDTPNAD